MPLCLASPSTWRGYLVIVAVAGAVVVAVVGDIVSDDIFVIVVAVRTAGAAAFAIAFAALVVALAAIAIAAGVDAFAVVSYTVALTADMTTTNAVRKTVMAGAVALGCCSARPAGPRYAACGLQGWQLLGEFSFQF